MRNSNQRHPGGGKTKAVTESLRARYMIPPNVAATFVLVAMVVIAWINKSKKIYEFICLFVCDIFNTQNLQLVLRELLINKCT